MVDVVSKAEALTQAWREKYGDDIGRNALLLLLAVADLETGMGEYRGVPSLQLLEGPSHNWGQIQRRTLTQDEKKSLAEGRIPTPRDSNEFLSGDTSPDTGAYHVWLWRFPDDIQGAKKLLSTIVDTEKIRGSIDLMTPYELAQSMYNARYYEGQFSRKDPDGPAKNVSAYGSIIASHYAALKGKLQNWLPGIEPGIDPAGNVPGKPDLPEPPLASVASDGPLTPSHVLGIGGLLVALAAFWKACNK